MSKTSFLAQMGITKMGQIGDAITSAIIQFDPETASAAQIAEYRHHCDDIAHRVAQAETEVNTANSKVNDLQPKLGRDREAAKALRASIGAATDQARITTLTSQATTIITQMKEIGGDDMTGESAGTLFDARTDLTQAQSDLAEWTSVHQQTVAQLTTAESAMKHAKEDMERAQREADRARERQRQAEQDAHLRSGLGQGTGVAVDAMTAQAAKMRENARAATLQADALHAAKGGDADAIVAATLAAAKPASSVLDDLNKL